MTRLVLAVAVVVGLVSFVALLAGSGFKPAASTDGSRGIPVSGLAIDTVVRAGWLGNDPVMLVAVSQPRPASMWLRYSLVDRQWESLTSLSPDVDHLMAATGGPSVAVVDRAGVVTITTPAADTQVHLPADPWVAQWMGRGSILADPAGGFVLSIAPVLARISATGVLTMQPAPAGQVVVAATSDPDRFVVTPDPPRTEPLDLSALQAGLWNLRTNAIEPVGRLDGTGMPSTVGLGWFGAPSRGWWLLNRDGTLEAVAGSAGVVAIAPDGRSRLTVPGFGNCPSQGTRPCPAVLQADGWNLTIAGPIVTDQGVPWNDAGSLAAYAPARLDLGRPAQLVVVDREGRETRIALPAAP